MNNAQYPHQFFCITGSFLFLMDCHVSFLAFCNLCEHLNRVGKIEQKKQKLSGFIEEWRKEDPKSLYSFVRLLLPHVSPKDILLFIIY